MKNIGVYVHIPFCKSKCPYCDFYSLRENEEKKNKYLSALLQEISSYENLTADTIYLGGGTPSVFGNDRLVELITKLKIQFGFSCGEITVEVNPSSCNEDLIESLSGCGVNRISIGMQSALDEERKILGRHSTADEIKNCVQLCRKHGIDNISLDIMLGVPLQTKQSLEKTLDFIISLNVKHISAYILKIEENTLFYRRQNELTLPDEDDVCDFYEIVCERLEKAGLHQYEISNFAEKGYKSHHNLKYWNCEEYLGLGSAAHSFLNGKRFFHERNFDEYVKKPLSHIDDGVGGSFEEFAMLKLRLSEGIKQSEVLRRFLHPIDEEILKRSIPFIKAGLMEFDGENLMLTRKGFLLSNTILAEIL